MQQDYIINSFQDTLYSCLMPYAKQFEYRILNHSIIFVRTGSLMLEQGGIITEVKAGTYVFVKRNCTTKIIKLSDGETPYRGINLMLHRPILKEFFGRLNKERMPKNFKPLSETAIILPKTVQLESLFTSFVAYVDNNQEPTEELLKMKTQEAIMALLAITPEFYPTLFDFNEAWKIDILDFMEENFTEDMTMEEFANYTGRSLATFKRDFARISDVTPQKWLNEKRLARAEEMLRKGKATAKDVYYLVGFKNRSHFSSIFKKRFGIPPSQVRVIL